MHSSAKIAISAVFLSILTQFAVEARASDFESPRIAALGGSGRAGPLLNDAIFLNPSYASFLNTYSLAANYELFNAGFEDASGQSPIGGHLLSLSIQDGRSDVFQAGIAVTRREDIALINLGGSKMIIADRLAIGVHGKLGLPNDGSGQKIFDAGFSGSYAYSAWLQASLTVDNLLQGKSAQARGFYRQVSLGTKLTLEGIAWFFIDPHWTPDLTTGQLGFNAGIEVPILTDLLLRAGKFNDSHIAFMNSVSSGYGLGIGWLAPKISLDYGFQRVITPVPGAAHIFGVTIYF